MHFLFQTVSKLSLKYEYLLFINNEKLLSKLRIIYLYSEYKLIFHCSVKI